MAEKAWMIDVIDEDKQRADIRKREEIKWEQRCIYKLPTCVTDLHKNAYKPRAVSFGPYHHGDPNLEALEDHKHRALFHFLERSKRPLDAYFQALNGVVRDLMDAYDSLDPFWRQNKDEFLQLMIRDGCFMLEILRTFTQSKNEDNGYARNDPIFSNHGKRSMMPYIVRDMLMLENQLPLLVLDKLLAVENPEIQKDKEFINRLVLKFCFPQFSDADTKRQLGKCLHVLHVYRKKLLLEEDSTSQAAEAAHQSQTKVPPGDNADLFKKIDTASGGNGCGGSTGIGSGGEIRISSSNGGIGSSADEVISVDAAGEMIQSAIELRAAGILLKKSKTASLKNITFRNGTLRLPPIVVNDSTELVFLNLMAFERFHAGAGKEVTEYIYFMGNIICNAKDSSLLGSLGIILNVIGSDKAAAQLFNSLFRDVAFDPDGSLGVVHREVDKFCRKRTSYWRANLLLTYFRDPWAIFTFYAFVFTILQTTYTIGQYYHK